MSKGKRYHVSSSAITKEARAVIASVFPSWDKTISGDHYAPDGGAGGLTLSNGTPIRLLTKSEAKEWSKSRQPARLQAKCCMCDRWFSTGTFNQHKHPCAKKRAPRILSAAFQHVFQTFF